MGKRHRQPTKRKRLEELKRQIAEGEYETPEKLEVALRRLLADLRAAKPSPVSREGDSGDESP